MKILLLSAYDARSHQHWREILQNSFSEVEWTVLTLPPRHFLWRIRGNALAWSVEYSELLAADYDLCIATSMVDVATLKGLNPSFSRLPMLLYFHENQFAYPGSSDQKKFKNVEPMLVQMYSALAADYLCFNSNYNRQSFLEGLSEMLERMPDFQCRSIIDSLASKSAVLPVPLNIDSADLGGGGLGDGGRQMGDKRAKKPNSFVWNHRWEYDKGPARLLAFLQCLPDDLGITVHVIGQSFRNVPPVFQEIKARLVERGWMGEWGYIDDQQRYDDLLSESQYVLSTSEHDFQGLSILEAVARDCIPILPARLAYSEFFDSIYLYNSTDDFLPEARNMVEKVLALMSSDAVAVPNIERFSVDELQPRYRAIFDRLVSECG